MAAGPTASVGRRRNRQRGDEPRDDCAPAEERRRRGRPIGVPVLRRRLRTARVPPRQSPGLDRGRSRLADLCGPPLSKRRGQLRALDAFQTPAARPYRAPYATAWQELELDTAMDMIADRLWAARDRGFVESMDGKPLMQLRTVAH